MTDKLCPICSCSRTLKESPTPVTNILGAKCYQCGQCGQFIYDKHTSDVPGFSDSKQLISAWIRHQNKLGNEYPVVGEGDITGMWFKNLRNMGFPQTVNEKLNGLLKAYAQIEKDDHLMIIKASGYPTLISDIAAKDYNEIKGLNKLLIELGYLSAQRDPAYEHVSITAKGWQRIDDLSKSTSTSDSAFIAMWYDPMMDRFLESTKQSVTACGYKPIIVNDTEFNGFIMDEVITLIRHARFLIADLTCMSETFDKEKNRVTRGVRGGVYWEAGIAYGMGKPVIQTCMNNEESIQRVHFDLDQYNTIRWEENKLITGIIDTNNPVENPSFAQQLAQHIMATVGKGSYTPPIE